MLIQSRRALQGATIGILTMLAGVTTLAVFALMLGRLLILSGVQAPASRLGLAEPSLTLGLLVIIELVLAVAIFCGVFWLGHRLICFVSSFRSPR